MSEPREETPTPVERPEEDEGVEQRAGKETAERPDYKRQDVDGGMPLPEYDIYREIPGERVGG